MPNIPAIDQGDVQGLILRSYGLSHVCHFTLGIKENEEEGARAFIRWILPQITSAEENPKPDYCLNIAFTAEGLRALDPERFNTIHEHSALEAFLAGAINRAKEVGDVEENSPDNWRGGQERWQFHVLLTLYARDQEILADLTKSLVKNFTEAFDEIGSGDRLTGALLEGDLFHFGFKDGIAQPIIAGAPERPGADGKQPDSPAGAFLLGYPSQWKGYKYPPFNTNPPDDEGSEGRTKRLTNEHFWRNGSFVAFRMLAQSVSGFEEFLTKESMRTGLNQELIAAKICGRWRNGYPLVLAPTADSAVADAQLNNFDYSLDPEGRRCPFGAHIRRANPRDDAIASDAGSNHRLVRRGMPYGPPYNAAIPDTTERGLLGMFICVNLQDQFEFIMKNWLNKSGFNGNLAPNHRDPFVGSPNAGREFVVPGAKEDTSLELSQFVTTRGGAYCFLPSITALRYLARLEPGREYPAPNEEEIIQKIGEQIGQIGQATVEMVQALKQEAARKGVPFKQLSKRDASQRLVHPKSHGSVRGCFAVNPDLADHLKVGIFQPSMQYPAFIRFSNGDMADFDDTHPDLRGMAMKLMVDGHEQDFNLVTHKVFFTRDPKDFLALATALKNMFQSAASTRSALTPEELSFGIRPYLARRPKQAQIFQEMQIDMKDPLAHPYYSQVPFKFGKGRAVKYAVIPIPQPVELSEYSKAESENRLRLGLAEHLRKAHATFKFCVQFQTDPAAMPIEDAMVEWDEQLSSFEHIATLTIEQQQPTDEFEGWSFRPANALPEHAPLGGINRARLAIYEAAARARDAKIPTPKATATAAGS